MLFDNTDVGRRHSLKSHKEPFQALWDGIRTFDVRVNDRQYTVGDSIMLSEYDNHEYTGRVIGAYVKYMIQGEWGLPNNVCVLGLEVWARTFDCGESRPTTTSTK